MKPQPGIILLLALLLLASFAASFLLFRQAKHYYQELNAIRLDPLGLREFQSPAHAGEPTLVLYGDSRAAQWPEPPWLAGQTLNFGINGQTTEQVLGRFPRHLAPLRPKIVLLEAGGNDLKTIPLFPHDEEKIIETCKRNLREIVDRSHRLGAHVVIATIFPVGKLPLQRRPVWSDRVDPAIEKVNRYIESLAADDVTVFVTAEVLTDQNGKLRAEYSRDFLHLSDEGYRQLNEGLRWRLESVLSGLRNHGSSSEPPHPPAGSSPDSGGS
jgi:lysophospholipase L1-like esterase